jgi:hypothetical protein
MAERICVGPCGKTLPETPEFFYFRKRSGSGKIYASPYCKSCEKAKAAKLRADKYATPNGKKTIDLQNRVYRTDPEHAKDISDHLKDRYKNDIEYRAERKANAKAWKLSNSKRNSSNKAAWFQKNKPRLREEWNKRFQEDPEFRLRNNLRRAIWEALRYGGGSKGGRSILDHLPYSMEDLKSHLEALWEPWMTWENYGVLDPKVRTWQIDHITPQVLLPFNDFAHANFLRCWALSNLRPLESSQNLSKGCRP